MELEELRDVLKSDFDEIERNPFLCVIINYASQTFLIFSFNGSAFSSVSLFQARFLHELAG